MKDHWGGTCPWWGIWEQGVQCNPGFRGPHIWLLGCQKKCRSSRPTPSDPPLLLWQLILPTSGECLTGRPTNPTTVHSSLSMVLVGNLAYLWCPSKSWASLRKIPILAIRWAGGLHCLSTVRLWLKAFRILGGAFQLRMSPPLGWERSHVSPIYSSLGISHAYPETYPSGSCSCGVLALNAVCFLAQLSIFTSNTWAASNTCQWASLTSQRASLCW